MLTMDKMVTVTTGRRTPTGGVSSKERTSPRVKGPPKTPKAAAKATDVCYYCMGKGHWKEDCPKFKEGMKKRLRQKMAKEYNGSPLLQRVTVAELRALHKRASRMQKNVSKEDVSRMQKIQTTRDVLARGLATKEQHVKSQVQSLKSVVGKSKRGMSVVVALAEQLQDKQQAIPADLDEDKKVQAVAARQQQRIADMQALLGSDAVQSDAGLRRTVSQALRDLDTAQTMQGWRKSQSVTQQGSELQETTTDAIDAELDISLKQRQLFNSLDSVSRYLSTHSALPCVCT